MMNRKKVAFICIHNSCRSQIAEALGKKYLLNVCDVYSAGTETKPQINQDAVRIMKNLYNIDMEKEQYSKLLSDIPNPDIAISMGCNVSCPFIGRDFDDNWGLDDPTGKSDEEFVKVINEIESKILELKDELSQKCSENEIRRKYEKLTKLLIEKGLTITTMESCSAGQIISLITDTEGASAVTKGGFVTYSNEAKIMQGVSAKIIETYGVYSKETAKVMAETCRKRYQANIGIGVTGTFGNLDPNNKDSTKGQVYFAIDVNAQVHAYERKLEVRQSRYEYKLEIARIIVDELLKYLLSGEKKRVE